MKHNFKINDKVIALTNPANDCCQQRIKGQKYIVKDIMYCSKCGKQSIHIGGKVITETVLNLSCKCGNSQTIPHHGWTNSKYFIKVDDLEQTLMEAEINEDYELCVLLRDNLKTK